jgi:hypothetical protein
MKESSAKNATKHSHQHLSVPCADAVRHAVSATLTARYKNEI